MFMSLTGWKFAINSSVGTMKKNGSRMRAGGHSVQSSSLAIISCGHCIGPNNTTQAGDSRSAPRGVLEHAHMRKGACLRRTVSAGVASAQTAPHKLVIPTWRLAVCSRRLMCAKAWCSGVQ
mmetsp:Transcript_21781/g.58217  ORF Transcript_21781/g.58217 Transcript_21781/m.58217 type:complete len:121 (+) Transcript_21781:516-878(+)